MVAALVLIAAAVGPVLIAAQPSNALPIDPRHQFDQRCPAAVTMDPSSKQRNPVSASLYLDLEMPANSTAEDCAKACCGDWSCEAFTFRETAAVQEQFSGSWYNHEPGKVHKLAITQSGRDLLVQSLEITGNNWVGEVSGRTGYLCFAGDPARKRSFNISEDNNTLFMSRLSKDAKSYSQNFTRAEKPFFGGCVSEKPCCSFRDDSFDTLVPGASGVRSGVRSKLPSFSPPYPPSTTILSTTVNPKIAIGINGDEFPITWGRDGNQYTGAGDNTQANGLGSPLSFFKVVGGPQEMGCDHPSARKGFSPSPNCTNLTLMGKEVVVGAGHPGVCPQQGSGPPNLKSSGVLSVDGVLYWAVSCFNYGDDAVSPASKKLTITASVFIDMSLNLVFSRYLTVSGMALLGS